MCRLLPLLTTIQPDFSKAFTACLPEFTNLPVQLNQLFQREVSYLHIIHNPIIAKNAYVPDQTMVYLDQDLHQKPFVIKPVKPIAILGISLAF